jgi:hypothetical protein
VGQSLVLVAIARACHAKGSVALTMTSVIGRCDGMKLVEEGPIQGPWW